MRDRQPIRICQVIGAMDRAGAETFLMNLYRHIDREQVQFDFLVHTDRNSDYDDEIRSLGGHIYRLPAISVANLCGPYQHACKLFFQEHQEFSAVHGHIGSTASLYLGAAKRAGYYTIAHSHNNKGPLSMQEIEFRVLSHSTRNVADFFLACSRQAGIDRYGIKIVMSSRFHVVFNGIETKAYLFDPAIRLEMRDVLGIALDVPVIGHVGRFAEQKNHGFVLRCFASVLKELPKAQLLLVGRGELRPAMEDLARQLGIQDHVKFLGVRDDVPRLLMSMDCFLFPSLYEGLGIGLIEAQAAGLPCLASDVIPKEARICPTARFKPLDDGPEAWAQDCVHMLTSVQSEGSQRATERRVQQNNLVRESGYDIASSAAWLQQFYLSRANSTQG